MRAIPVTACLVGAAMAAGCWATTTQPATPVVTRSEPPPPPSAIAALRPHVAQVSPCEQALDHAIELLRDQLDQDPSFHDHVDAIRDAAVESCWVTDWNSDALHCFGDAPTSVEVSRCGGLLTSEQSSDMTKRITTAIRPAP